MEHHLLNKHVRISDDLDYARDVLGRLWHRHEIAVRTGWKYHVRWHQVDFRSTSLSYTDSPTSVRVASGPVDGAYHLGLHEAGRMRHLINGREAVSAPETAVVHAPGQELQLETEPFRALMVTFDRKRVDALLARRFGPLPAFEDWAREIPVSSAPLACLRSLCRWMAVELDQPGCWLLSSSRAAGGLERAMLGLFLDCLSERQPQPKRRTDDASARQVQRALEWLDGHFADPVGVEDLAEVAGVGVRSLQTAFRRLHGCTPMQALTQRRLRAAHEALEAAFPTTTVTQVAADCGFFHFGRFARDYRLAFGETPSTTLRRARRR